MDKERANGIELLAIPHNANMSDGLMYEMNTYDGQPLTKALMQKQECEMNLSMRFLNQRNINDASCFI